MISQKTGSLTPKTPPLGGVLTDPIAPLPVTFQPDTPYDPADDLAAPDIREDFSDLTYGAGYDPQSLLDRLAVWLPADRLRDFMDDLAMGRI
jgi:hypothetical protein